VDQHLLGVGREIGELVDRRALPRELRRLVGRPNRPALAEVRAPGQAVLAVAAEDREARDDVVARLELRHVRADRVDDPRRLMPEDGGRRERVEAFDEVEIAVADAARHRAHQYLARDGLGDVDVLDRELFVRPVEDGSFHVALLWRVWTGVYRRPAPLRRGEPHNRRTRGNSSAPASASVTSAAPLVPSATPTPNNDASAPSPSGPTPRTSRARLGKSAWCAKPRISAPAVSSMSAGSTGSFRIAVTKSTMLCHRDPAAGGVVPTGADADSKAAEPAR